MKEVRCVSLYCLCVCTVLVMFVLVDPGPMVLASLTICFSNVLHA